MRQKNPVEQASGLGRERPPARPAITVGHQTGDGQPLLRPIRPRDIGAEAGDVHLARRLSPRPSRQVASGEADHQQQYEAVEPAQLVRQRKRNRHSGRDRRSTKRIRASIRRQRRRELQAEDLASVLRFLEDIFAVKESLSNEQTWCAPIPHERKVSTVQAFYKAFHDTSTLPIRTCMLCYRKRTKMELRKVIWDQWLSSRVAKGDRSPFSCRSCFPVGETVSICAECVRCLARGGLSPAAQLHSRHGCEHIFPDELKGLTPVEEKLISLNSCYGFVTRYSIPGGQRQTVTYPRHVKGHITVFPNNVQELVTKVLPHPILQVMEEIHVSWHGAEKPAPGDLSSVLSVRRRVIERALVWLRRGTIPTTPRPRSMRRRWRAGELRHMGCRHWCTIAWSETSRLRGKRREQHRLCRPRSAPWTMRVRWTSKKSSLCSIKEKTRQYGRPED